MSEQTTGFESWALLELFGHQRMIGFVTEATIGGVSLLRVDVPESNGEQAFTKYYGNGAVYALTPVTEVTAKTMLENFRRPDVVPYDLQPRQQHTIAIGGDHDDLPLINEDDEEFDL